MRGALDIRTLTLACAVVHLGVAWVMTYVWLRRKTYPGFTLWVLSGWCSLLGMLLLFLRGALPDVFTIVLANLCLMASVLAIQAGLIAFSGLQPNFIFYKYFIAILGGFLLLFTYAHPSLRMRLVLISAIVAGFSLRSAYISWKRLGRDSGIVNPVVVSSLLGVGLLYGVRGVLAYLWPPSSNDFMKPSVIQGLALLADLGVQAVMSSSLLVLNGQRLEQELLQSLEECKVLRGIIPICAYCKKIRDDAGAWSQVENYIRKHSEARFSHGICPECAEKELLNIRSTLAARQGGGLPPGEVDRGGA